MKKYTTIPSEPQQPESLENAAMASTYAPQIPTSETNTPTGPSVEQKVKGAAQMAAGAVVAAAGVPMLILPGPGAMAIAGGAALASKGQRNFSGREATALEEKLDAAADKMATITKEKAEETAQKIATEAPVVAEKAARKVEAVTEGVTAAANEAAPAVMDTARKAGSLALDATEKAAVAGAAALGKLVRRL